ncbi:MAG: T9SS type A sorting domain-containing protein, partial [Bacteroidia bacterium]|nr:T9SS type A sorting domain-containing protein [Bacteroidia bacterium]
GNYTVTLQARNINNCDSIIQKQITITNTSLNDLAKKIAVKVYPNPFANQVNIDLENENKGQLFILDVNGKNIETISLTKNQTLDLSHLAKGIYVLKMEVNQQTAYYKLVKE